jgi:hypothetical protein
MALFVNREKELDFIGDAVQTLLDRRRLLRTPIIEVYGARGMGKTALLKQVEQYCLDSSLPCIFIDIKHASVNLEDDLIRQISQYLPHPSSPRAQSAISFAGALLKRGPAVMLFDSVDLASQQQIDVLQLLLSNLIDHENLFVVLASKKPLPFLQKEPGVARKLTPISLQSLSRGHSEDFLASAATKVEAEIRDLILEWTRGYPLAMNVMVDAVNSGLDPRSNPGQAEMLARLKDQVLYQEVLGDLEPQRRAYYYSALQLFSLPRRFSLVIMQDLIETFLPELRRDGVLAYLSLPRDICETTNVMHWNMARAGYAVDTPVRALFLLLLKQEQPDRYFAIHAFLAKRNLELALEVSGSDRARYLREHLYHLVNSRNPSEQSLIGAVEIVNQQAPDVFVSFAEEFAQDDELKEALGSRLPMIEAAIHKYQQEETHADREGEE